MNHQDGFEAEAKFHEALAYLCERYQGFQSKNLKKIMHIIDPSMENNLFKRRECKRELRYIGENNDHFSYGVLYSSSTFNGATYEVQDNIGNSTILGSLYFERIR